MGTYVIEWHNTSTTSSDSWQEWRLLEFRHSPAWTQTVRITFYFPGKQGSSYLLGNSSSTYREQVVDLKRSQGELPVNSRVSKIAVSARRYTYMAESHSCESVGKWQFSQNLAIELSYAPHLLWGSIYRRSCRNTSTLRNISMVSRTRVHNCMMPAFIQSPSVAARGRLYSCDGQCSENYVQPQLKE